MKTRNRSIYYILLCILIFIYISVVFDFSLFHHARRRAFLFDTDFISPFFRYVAGPIDCLASLVTQLYYYPWLGALIIFSVLLSIYFASTVVLRSFGQKSVLLSAMPAVLGLFLLEQHITAFSLISYAFSLCAVALYVRLIFLPTLARVATFSVLSAIVCYFAGGTTLLFAFICALNTLVVHKQRGLTAIYLVVGVLIPFGMGALLFEPDRVMQYFLGIPLKTGAPFYKLLGVAWFAFWPLSIFGTVFSTHLRSIHIRVLKLLGVLAPALMCAVMLNHRYYRYNPTALDYYAENGEWEEALAYARRFPENATRLTVHIVNHALYQTGRLPYDMFDYPQLRDDRLLLLGVSDNEKDPSPRSANRRSDIFYFLGRIDQAERWSHEVLTNQGFQGGVLNRLISINLLKGRPNAARVYAGVMQKTVTHSERASEIIASLEKGAPVPNVRELDRIRPLLPKNDYVGEWTTRDILNQLLREAPANRMAFEYLMAHLLITGNIMEFGRNVHRVEAFGYKELPRVYAEACLVYTLAAGEKPPNLRLGVPEETLEQFRQFMAQIQKYEGNRPMAWDVLKGDFGGTYWFFKVFGRTGVMSTPDFNTEKKK